jgi:hypothetical protein
MEDGWEGRERGGERRSEVGEKRLRKCQIGLGFCWSGEVGTRRYFFSGVAQLRRGARGNEARLKNDGRMHMYHTMAIRFDPRCGLAVVPNSSVSLFLRSLPFTVLEICVSSRLHGHRSKVRVAPTTLSSFNVKALVIVDPDYQHEIRSLGYP